MKNGKCESCLFWGVLNPHRIEGDEPVKSCSSGEQPDTCREYKERVKPKCKLVGTDGNVFSLAGRVRQALKHAGQEEQAEEFETRLYKCGSYDAALQLMLEYVEAY